MRWDLGTLKPQESLCCRFLLSNSGSSHTEAPLGAPWDGCHHPPGGQDESGSNHWGLVGRRVEHGQIGLWSHWQVVFADGPVGTRVWWQVSISNSCKISVQSSDVVTGKCKVRNYSMKRLSNTLRDVTGITGWIPPEGKVVRASRGDELFSMVRGRTKKGPRLNTSQDGQRSRDQK